MRNPKLDVKEREESRGKELCERIGVREREKLVKKKGSLTCEYSGAIGEPDCTDIHTHVKQRCCTGPRVSF